jgi:RadC-like JAB domain
MGKETESGYSVCQGGIVKALVHNHPSQNISPSRQDMKTAAKYHVKVCVVTDAGVKCYRPRGKK